MVDQKYLYISLQEVEHNRVSSQEVQGDLQQMTQDVKERRKKSVEEYEHQYNNSGDDSMQENSVELECLSNVSKGIIRKRKTHQSHLKSRIKNHSRYLWDYGYDTQESHQDDMLSKFDQSKYINIDSSFEQSNKEHSINTYSTLIEKKEHSIMTQGTLDNDQIKKDHLLIQQQNDDDDDDDENICKLSQGESQDNTDEDDSSQIDERFITEFPQGDQEDFEGKPIYKQMENKNEKLPIIIEDNGEGELNQILNIEKFKNTQSVDVYQKDSFAPIAGKIRRDRYWDQQKKFFVCASGGASSENFNSRTLEELEKLQKFYTQEKDLGRQIAYRKAVSVIKSLGFELTGDSDVNKIMGIGEKTKEKIKEILRTGKCEKAQILGQNERNKSIGLLSQVWGIGPSKAASLYDGGVRSIEDLRKNENLLSRNQKIGLKYYEDILERMPRNEASAILNEIESCTINLFMCKIIYLNSSLKGIKRMYPEDFDRFEVVACGSYRRGKETCGDLDVLISRKDGEDNKPKNLMLNLIEELEKNGLLIENLQMPRLNSYGSESYMGIGRLKGGKHRRIDLKYYPNHLYGYAILYFTGSDYFNRSMRLFARKKGYSLSDHGLYPVQRLSKSTKVAAGLAIMCYTEEQVFKALNLEYKPPNMRSV